MQTLDIHKTTPTLPEKTQDTPNKKRVTDYIAGVPKCHHLLSEPMLKQGSEKCETCSLGLLTTTTTTHPVLQVFFPYFSSKRS